MLSTISARRSEVVLIAATGLAAAMFGSLAGCASSDTGTANVAAASPTATAPLRIGAGDDLGLSLRTSDQVWAHVQTSSD